MKLVIIVLLLAIVFSLGSGLFFLTKDDRGSRRLQNALRVRVALSIVLVVFLIAAYFGGWIEPPR